MIYLLKGIVVELAENFAVVDVNGVGYQVFASSRSLNNLREGEATTVHIHTHVREDQITLFGFADTEERSMFNCLNDVNGVGAKMALAVLSALSPAEIAEAVNFERPGDLTRAKGVGKKLAERMILELKGKLKSAMPQISQTAISQGSAVTASQMSAPVSVVSDVVSALANMGFKASDAQAAATQALQAHGSEEFGALFKESLAILRG